jgi:hypothetical protein
MKLSNIIVAVGLASATFLAITNREKFQRSQGNTTTPD